jgi:hypothetical protein
MQKPLQPQIHFLFKDRLAQLMNYKLENVTGQKRNEMKWIDSIRSLILVMEGSFYINLCLMTLDYT